MRKAALFVLAAGSAVSIAQAQDILWNNAGGGSWNLAANWSPMNIPNTASERAIIALAGAYVVTVDSIILVGGLELTGSNAALHVSNLSLLRMSGDIINNRTIAVNPSAGGNVTQIQFEVIGTVSGTGEIILNAGNNLGTASLRSGEAGTSVTNGSGHTVRGTGSIQGTFVNEGVVDADRNGLVLAVLGTTTNNATMGASNGGILRVGSSSFSQSAVGRLLSSGGTVELNGASVSGGVIEGVGEWATRVGATTPNVSDVTVVGPLDIGDGRTLVVRGGGLTNNGLITVNDTAGVTATFLQFESDGTLGGSGAVLLNASAAPESATLRSSGAGAVVRNGADHAIRGTGVIEGTFVNDGVVNADESGLPLTVHAATTNNATVGASEGGILRVTSPTFVQGAGGRLRADAGVVQLSGATVNGGLVETVGDGVTQVEVGFASTLSDVTVSGRLNIAGGATLRVRGGGLTNNGVIVINEPFSGGAAMRFEVNGVIGGSGVVVVNLFGRLTSSGAGSAILNGPSHTIAGTGSVEGPFTNAGRINPGDPFVPTASLHFDDGWSNLDTGSVDLELGGTQAGTYDIIYSNGNISLDGTLNVTLVNDFLPARGASIDLMSAPSIVGRFQTLNLPELPADYGYARIEYTPTHVRLRIPLCRADWNAVDGGNSQDFFDFLTDFFAEDADYNRDGPTNSQDFFDFLTNFFMPCA